MLPVLNCSISQLEFFLWKLEKWGMKALWKKQIIIYLMHNPYLYVFQTQNIVPRNADSFLHFEKKKHSTIKSVENAAHY